MATYLLTWNPKRKHWWDENNLEGIFERVGDFYYGDWSSGNSKRIHPDDRVFMIKLGKEPRGIVASGWAVSDVYENTHWEEDRADAGETGLYVDVMFDTILNPGRDKIFPRKNLDGGILGKMYWDARASGVQIPDGVAAKLEKEWEQFLGKGKQSLPVAEPSAFEGLQTETVRYTRGRSRHLRDLALENSEGICSVCEIDYSKVLDGKGVRVLQVHHKKQLAATEAPKLTRLSDLAVVCANCHMLIHMNPKHALKVETLKKMLGKSPKA